MHSKTKEELNAFYGKIMQEHKKIKQELTGNFMYETHWTTKEGENILYEEMDDGHLRNAMLMLQRKLPPQWSYLLQESVRRKLKGVGLMPDSGKITYISQLKGIPHDIYSKLKEAGIETLADFGEVSQMQLQKLTQLTDVEYKNVYLKWTEARR